MRRRVFFSTIRLALDTVREHKMRSFLTVLGVIIGSGTIIAVGSIIAGLDSSISGIFEGLGANSAMAFKVPPLSGHLTPEELNRKPLTYEDAVAIQERCPDVQGVSPLLFPPGIFQGQALNRVKYKGNDMFNMILRGTDESFLSSGNAGEMVNGRFFTDEENRHRMPVVVLGAVVTKAIMANEDPIGKWVDLNGSEFEVVGVMDKPANSFPGVEYRWALLPYFTMQKVFPTAKENLLIISSKPGRLSEAIDEARVVLRLQRHVPFNKPDNFAITTGDQMVEKFHQVTGMVALVMIVLSSVGLLVGGIGVMNIMLVSVTERTREIGVRKAIGARRSDIILQFLTEAVVLTGIGGLVGMTLGWLVSLIVRLIFPALPTAVPLWAAILGVGVSIGVGLFFGIWPANKAARLDPVEALRYE
jgi:putative ABC transport system permease protein